MQVMKHGQLQRGEAALGKLNATALALLYAMWHEKLVPEPHAPRVRRPTLLTLRSDKRLGFLYYTALGQLRLSLLRFMWV